VDGRNVNDGMMSKMSQKVIELTGDDRLDEKAK
jgi:hypothetical protein